MVQWVIITDRRISKDDSKPCMGDFLEMGDKDICVPNKSGQQIKLYHVRNEKTSVPQLTVPVLSASGSF